MNQLVGTCTRWQVLGFGSHDSWEKAGLVSSNKIIAMAVTENLIAGDCGVFNGLIPISRSQLSSV